jgi:hypothetical protein
MLTQDQHFTIETKAGFPRCVPKSPEAASAYKTLQLLLVRLVKQLPNAPKMMLSIDGVIGPSTVLAVQLIATRLAEGKYPTMVDIASAQPEEAIPFVAVNAMEIADAFDQAVSADRTALLSPQQLEEAQPDPVAMLKGFLTIPKIAAVGFGLLGLTGIALAARTSDKRSAGLVDRSRFLPESDGTDDFDDEGHDEGDDESAEPEQIGASEAPAADESAHAA